MDITNTQDAIPVEAMDLESIFAAHYDRVARTIAFVIGDGGRAEELAVEVFLRWPRRKHSNWEAWIYRTAVNLAIDELRKQARRRRFDGVLAVFVSPQTPEEIHHSNQERDRVRSVLARMQPRDAELLILRAQGFSYQELAAALALKPGSVGTLLSRAGETFRKEYIAKYGPRPVD